LFQGIFTIVGWGNWQFLLKTQEDVDKFLGIILMGGMSQ